MRILIPDGHTNNVLAATRSLGRAGHRITLGLTEEVWSRRMLSKYVEGTIRITNPREDTPRFIKDMLIHQKEYDALMPFSHEKTIPISQWLDYLTIPTTVPEYKTLEYGHDKGLTIQTCIALGIPTPQTWFTIPGEEPSPEELEYPLVIKARKHCGVSTGIRYAHSPEEFTKGFTEITTQPNVGRISQFNNPLVQEYLPGELYDVVGLYQKGECKAAVAQKRVETIPPEGGPGVYNKTIHEPKLVEQSCRLLNHIKWHGPYQTEWKLDPKDGQYKIIELNPKMWGTMELSIRAGVNIPIIALGIALGEEVEPKLEYKIGAKKFWPLSIIQNVKKEPTFRRLAMCSYLPEMLDIRDPRPDLYDMAATLKRML